MFRIRLILLAVLAAACLAVVAAPSAHAVSDSRRWRVLVQLRCGRAVFSWLRLQRACSSQLRQRGDLPAADYGRDAGLVAAPARLARRLADGDARVLR